MESLIRLVRIIVKPRAQSSMSLPVWWACIDTVRKKGNQADSCYLWAVRLHLWASSVLPPYLSQACTCKSVCVPDTPVCWQAPMSPVLFYKGITQYVSWNANTEMISPQGLSNMIATIIKELLSSEVMTIGYSKGQFFKSGKHIYVRLHVHKEKQTHSPNTHVMNSNCLSNFFFEWLYWRWMHYCSKTIKNSNHD